MGQSNKYTCITSLVFGIYGVYTYSSLIFVHMKVVKKKIVNMLPHIAHIDICKSKLCIDEDKSHQLLYQGELYRAEIINFCSK